MPGLDAFFTLRARYTIIFLFFCQPKRKRTRDFVPDAREIFYATLAFNPVNLDFREIPAKRLQFLPAIASCSGRASRREREWAIIISGVISSEFAVSGAYINP